MKPKAANSAPGAPGPEGRGALLPACQLVGILLGLAPLALRFQGVSSRGIIFWGIVVPLACGLAAWLLGLWALTAKEARTSILKNWLSGIRAGYAWLLAVCLLLALAGFFHLQAGEARQDLLAFFRANLEQGSTGLRGFKYRASHYAGKPAWTGIAPIVALDSARDARWHGEHYSDRWVAFFELERGAAVELGTESDDGSLLLIDGGRLVENLGLHPPRVKTARVRLAPGGHTLELLHFQARGGAKARLIIPPDLAAGLIPLKAGLDIPGLWVLDRTVEWRQNRAWLMLGLGLALLGLCLLPHPRGWPARAGAWLRRHVWHLALLAGLGLVMGVQLNSNPGLHFDPAHFGVTSWVWHWQAKTLYHWSSYTTQESLILPAYLLQKVLPLSVATLRLVPVVLNLAGLLWLGLAVERWFGRKTSLLFMLLLGTSVHFLVTSRYFVEMTAYMTFCAGLALWGLGRARDSAWGGPLCALALAAAVYIHGLLSLLALGAGLGLLAALGPKLFRSRRFWLGAGLFALLMVPWLWNLFSGRMQHAPNATPWPELLAWLGKVLGDGIPHTLSGRYMARFYAGEVLYYVPPLVPLLFLALAAVWPFQRFSALENQVLRGLLAAALALAVAGALKIGPEGPELRYFWPPVFCLWLWLALRVALLCRGAGAWKWLGAGAAATLCLAGLYVYGLDCLYAFSRSQGLPPAVYPPYCSGVVHHVNQRPLYRALAAQDRPVSYLGGDSRHMWFHELEDLTGRLGLLPLDEHRTQPGNLVVEFIYPWSKGIPKGARPYPLPPGLEGKNRAYVMPPAAAAPKAEK